MSPLSDLNSQGMCKMDNSGSVNVHGAAFDRKRVKTTA